MSNPIANLGQFAAEKDVIALWQDEGARAARQIIVRLWMNGWQGLPLEPVLGGPRVLTQVVKLAALRDVSPSDSAFVGPTDRVAKRADRRGTYARRF